MAGFVAGVKFPEPIGQARLSCPGDGDLVAMTLFPPNTWENQGSGR